MRNREIEEMSSTSSTSSLSETSETNGNADKRHPGKSADFIRRDFISNLMNLKNNSYSKYLHKLINKNLLTYEKPKTNNIFIFDWDDTLFCTTMLCPEGYFDEEKEISEKILEKIEKLEDLVRNLLMKCIEKGDTYIITNSELDWVHYSCINFFPSVYELFEKIKIISTRDLYEEKYPKDIKTWKIKAYNSIAENYSKNAPTNIISVGDSSYEVEAGYNMVKNFPNGFLKVIKFREFPLISDIIKQITYILEKFHIIYNTCKNCEICI